MKKIVKEKTTTLKCKKIDKSEYVYTFYTHKIPTEKELVEKEIWVKSIMQGVREIEGKTYYLFIEPTKEYKTEILNDNLAISRVYTYDVKTHRAKRLKYATDIHFTIFKYEV